MTPAKTAVSLGLRENLAQFSLLVLVNAFVGGMVGIERSILPLLGRDVFHIASTTVILTFIASFGAVKALANLGSGTLSDRIGRRGLLIGGWAVGLLVPINLLLAPSWGWVIFANALLGINQGLCWSMTVVMKIDLVGPRQRGVAMGLNEAAGYVAVAVTAYVTAALAVSNGLRTLPFQIGIAIAITGFLLSVLFIRETHGHAKFEADMHSKKDSPAFSDVFARTSLRDPALSSCCQAGLVNNLNDGMVWGLLPLAASTAGFTVLQIGAIAATYPFIWGVLQTFTGALSDRYGRKRLIASGMVVQAVAISAFAAVGSYVIWLAAAILLGVGTAMVYPALLAAIGDGSHPTWRASAVGVYRLWRDGGYVVGAVVSGIVADALGSRASIAFVAMLTLASGVLLAIRMPEALRGQRNTDLAG